MANTSDKELEALIHTAKSMLPITSDFDEFTYTINKSDSAPTPKRYHMSWWDKANKLGRINTTFEENGNLIPDLLLLMALMKSLLPLVNP